MNLKRSAKSFALDFARRGPESLSRYSLGAMRIGFEPPVFPVRYPEGKSASACISVDYDHFTNASKEPRKFEPSADGDKLKLNRAGTRLLVDLSRKHDIPMTWAICGKTAEADMNSYMKIVDSNQGHEIGIHTYSHIDVSACDEQELELEVGRCIDSLKLESTPRTFVFPWNRAGHFDKLKRMGFVAYRGRERMICAPKQNEGLWDLPPVFYMYQSSLKDLGLLKRFVDLCVEKRSVFHLWTHPWSVVIPERPELIAERLIEPLFAYIDEKRKAGLISVATMGEISLVAQEFNSGSKRPVAPIGAL